MFARIRTQNESRYKHRDYNLDKFWMNTALFVQLWDFIALIGSDE